MDRCEYTSLYIYNNNSELLQNYEYNYGLLEL